MKLFPEILVANFVTLVITIIAAIEFRLWGYRLIGFAALTAFLFALHQFQTGKYHPATLVFTATVVWLITVRVLADCWTSRRR